MPKQDIVQSAADLDEVIHRCLLNEVFLLLDFISGRPDCTLTDLDGTIDPAQPGRAMTSTETLMVLNHIRYPPPDSPADRARDATVLLQAKDRLNSLSRPATGLSVAYTTMFAGGAATPGGWWASRPHWMLRGEAADPVTRATLAVAAYPSLIGSAKRFRLAVAGLMVGALTVTLLSVWVSYEVAFGRSLMLRLDALDRQQTELATRIYAAEQSMAATGAGKIARLCAENPRSVDQQQLCDLYGDWQQKNTLAYRDLQNYTRLWGLQALTPHPPAGQAGPAGAPASGQAGQSEQLAASILASFSTTILPVLFGLLGTTAAVVRSIYGHVRERTLTPRQLNLALIRLPLGLVAGVSVGLLFSPDAASVQGASGLAGGLNLSASSVAFLAGYGVEAVFSLFDAVLKRVFTQETPAPTPTTVRRAP